MTTDLNNIRVATLVTDGFEQVELVEPVNALRERGALVKLVSPAKGQVRAWDRTNWGKEFPVDASLDDANPADYDALLLPGGVWNPDKLRMDPNAVEFVRHFVETGKPIAAICHGPWTLIEAHATQERRMTSYPSLRTDLENAGARWVDEEVVVDGNLVTSRNPDDIPAFIERTKEAFGRTPAART